MLPWFCVLPSQLRSGTVLCGVTTRNSARIPSSTRIGILLGLVQYELLDPSILPRLYHLGLRLFIFTFNSTCYVHMCDFFNQKAKGNFDYIKIFFLYNPLIPTSHAPESRPPVYSTNSKQSERRISSFVSQFKTFKIMASNPTISSSVPGHISSHNTTNSAQHGTYSFRINEVGGYEADFVSPINRDYECPICQFAFRDPVQTRECGHRFCESCLEPILRYVSFFREIYRKFSVTFDPILIFVPTK